MNIEKLWNDMNFDERMNFLPIEFPVIRNKKTICCDNWLFLCTIERKLIREIYTHKNFNISFKIKCNDVGAHAIAKAFNLLMLSKNWDLKDVKITW